MHTLKAVEIKEKFLSGELSAVAITQYFLERIKHHDEEIGAFLAVFEKQAIAQAEALDRKKAEGKPLGKLAGIPIAIKDNIHIDGELTTCASKFLENYNALFDATVTKLIKEEDGIILGKTNLDEFAMGSSTEHSAFQKTYNPWNLKCVPGGSSGGSAAAVSARLAPLALGSDTGGSVRQPASLCGVVGYKPTYGRVSRYGLVAFGSSLDQIGPFATCTEDTALLMEVIGRHCNNDSTSIAEAPEDYTSILNQPIKGKKIGVPWKFLEEAPEETMKSFKDALAVFEKQGCEIVEVDLEIMRHSIPAYYILSSAEASTNLARFDGVRYGHRSKKAQTLSEVYDFSKEEGFGKEVKRRILLGTFVLSAGYQDAFYKKAQRVRTLMINCFSKAFTKCDIIATPVTATTAFEMGSIQDALTMYLQDIFTNPINLAGVPAISTPCGFSKDGLPFGLQLIGPQKEDRRVHQFAHQYEQATQFHKQMPEQFEGASKV